MRQGDPTIRVEDASDQARLELAKHLFRSYAAEFAGSIAETLCLQGFEAEVAGLPGRYAPPSGCLLLAMDGDSPAGCVALRDLGGGTCEMKRLFVPPEHRGRGVGRRLVEEVIGMAEREGYRRMVLDTVPEMDWAIALYRGFGFVETAPYRDFPVERTVYMGRTLGLRASEESHPMGDENLAAVVRDDLAAYFEHLAARIERLARSLSDEELWARPFGFGNSVGRLVVHLTGNLSHYIGAKVAGTGYVRDRAAEFADPSRPATDVLLRDFREAIEMVVRTLRSQGEGGLAAPVSDCGEPVRDRFGLFLVCAAHVSNHVGQMAYLVQALGHPLDEKSW